jgi:hypothetical protein
MNTPYEAPWLKNMTDQRVELMVKEGAIDIARESSTLFIMSLLDEGDEDMTEEEQELWERTCDNCGRYIAPDSASGEDYYTGYTVRNIEDIQILLAFGVCGTCKAADERSEA